VWVEVVIVQQELSQALAQLQVAEEEEEEETAVAAAVQARVASWE
jgi:hypothetical protein